MKLKRILSFAQILIACLVACPSSEAKPRIAVLPAHAASGAHVKGIAPLSEKFLPDFTALLQDELAHGDVYEVIAPDDVKKLLADAQAAQAAATAAQTTAAAAAAAATQTASGTPADSGTAVKAPTAVKTSAPAAKPTAVKASAPAATPTSVKASAPAATPAPAKPAPAPAKPAVDDLFRKADGFAKLNCDAIIIPSMRFDRIGKFLKLIGTVSVAPPGKITYTWGNGIHPLDVLKVKILAAAEAPDLAEQALLREAVADLVQQINAVVSQIPEGTK